MNDFHYLTSTFWESRIMAGRETEAKKTKKKKRTKETTSTTGEKNKTLSRT